MGGQLFLLFLGGRLTAGLKLFNGALGKTQGGRQRGAAQIGLGAEGLDALCHGYHRKKTSLMDGR